MIGSDTEFSELKVAAGIEVGAKCCESLILDLEERARLGSERGSVFVVRLFGRASVSIALPRAASYLCARRKPFTLKMLSSIDLSPRPPSTQGVPHPKDSRVAESLVGRF